MNLKRTSGAIAVAAMTLAVIACGTSAQEAATEDTEPQPISTLTQQAADQKQEPLTSNGQSESRRANAGATPKEDEPTTTLPAPAYRSADGTPTTNRTGTTGPVIVPQRTATPVPEPTAAPTIEANPKPREAWREFNQAQYEELLPTADEIRATGVTWTESAAISRCLGAGRKEDVTPETLQAKIANTWAPRGYSHVFLSIEREMQGLLEDQGGDYEQGSQSKRGEQLITEAKCLTFEAVHPELPVIRSGMEVAVQRITDRKWDHWRVGAYWMFKETFELDEINRWIPSREVELIGKPFVERVECETRHMRVTGPLCE